MGEASGKSWGEQVRAFFPDADDDLVVDILWEMTCYPFDVPMAIKQLKALAEKVEPSKEGWRDRLAIQVEKEWDEMWAAMKEAERNEANA